MKRSVKVACLAFLGLAVLGGCESSEKDDEAVMIQGSDLTLDDVSTDAILADLTPELINLRQRPVDSQVDIARSINMDWRLFWEDWGKVMLFDRQLRLNERPIP
ncbi:MAG: hypothetical protein D8M59_02725 [Planctomycetes bacterium]|nr:hypothetical protein [Planctomycetota bacterium]NOG52906.1 hypothetical protein [Planctomycetota bacterium]